LASKDYEEIIKRIVSKSFGQIERCVIASEDGLPLATYGNPDEVSEIIAAIAAPLFVATQEVMKNLEKTKVIKIDVELTNAKHLVIARLQKGILALITSSKPNLGLVYCLIESEMKRSETRESEVEESEELKLFE